MEEEIKNYNAILKLKIEIRCVLVNQFTSTAGCYEIIQELKERGYKIFPYISGGLGNFLNAITQKADSK